MGALGLNTFDDEIEDASNILVNRIVSDINNTSNYVLATSNILVGRIRDEVGYTSNYVLATSNVLATRIKALEGTEGTPGDVNLGIPAIPSTGGFAVATVIVALTAACVLDGVSVLTMITSLEICLFVFVSFLFLISDRDPRDPVHLFFFLSLFLFVVFVSGRLRIWRGVVEDLVQIFSCFKGYFSSH